MSFSLETLRDLDYDFTEIPHTNGKKGEFCTGKGTIPEPTEASLEAYAEAYSKLMVDADDPDKGMTKRQFNDRLMAITAALCGNTPSKADLKTLPPRARVGFLKWVAQEVANPEV